MAMTKKLVREAKRNAILRINVLGRMNDEQLMAEVKRAWPQVVEATREEQLLFLIKDYIDRSFPDHLIS